MEINEILNGCSDEQIKAITTTEGNIRLIAGAGSGKTSALTKRVAYISAKNNISPERILSLTFTNKAAEEMRERVAKLLNVEQESLQMMTFHRLALNICRKFLAKLGYPTKVEDGEEIADFNIGTTPISAIANDFFKEYPEVGNLNKDDFTAFTSAIIRYTNSCIKGHNYVDMLLESEIELTSPEAVINYTGEKKNLKSEKDKTKRQISNLRKEIKDHYGKTSDNYEFLRSIRRKETQVANMKIEGENPIKPWATLLLQRKISTKTLDFDDLLMFAEYLLSNFEDVKSYWQNQYDYIQVDEFQDTDWIQLRILKILSEKSHGLFVVGDPDQSIYMFRGVKPIIFNTLEEHIKPLETIYMNNNYRSAEAIIEASNAVIKLNKNRIKKTSKYSSGIIDMEAPLLCVSAENYTAAQLEFNQIKKMLRAGVEPDNIAVLYRDKNCAVTGELVDLLRGTDIPLDCQYQRTTFADSFSDIVLNFLKYKHSKQMNFVGNFIEKLYGNDYEGIFDISNFDNIEISSSSQVFNLIEKLYPKKLTKNGSPTGKYKNFVENTNSIKKVITDTVEEWNSLSKNEKDILCSDDAVLNGDENVVNGIHIITIHKSKGLEFDYVFANMDNGSCPNTNQFTTLDSLEEDARLAYVAITRAKKQIYLGFQNTDTMSPFIAKSNIAIKPLYAGIYQYPDNKCLMDKIEAYERLLDCYFMLNYEGIYELHSPDGSLVGYRYMIMLNGSRKYYDISLKDFIKAGIEPPEAVLGSCEVLVNEDGLRAYEANNGTVEVINLSDSDKIKDLFDYKAYNII